MGGSQCGGEESGVVYLHAWCLSLSSWQPARQMRRATVGRRIGRLRARKPSRGQTRRALGKPGGTTARKACDIVYWDEGGGIPGAELVEDVIPSEEEEVHAAEYFQETALPGRTYTFGICDFNREGGPVTLQVTDPDGSVRTFEQYLYGNGDSAVITTSPLISGFIPEEWCRYDDGE